VLSGEQGSAKATPNNYRSIFGLLGEML